MHNIQISSVVEHAARMELEIRNAHRILFSISSELVFGSLDTYVWTVYNWSKGITCIFKQTDRSCSKCVAAMNTETDIWVQWPDGLLLTDERKHELCSSFASLIMCLTF